MRMIARLILGLVLGVASIAQAQPPSLVRAVVGIVSWGERRSIIGFPGVLVGPDEIYGLVGWEGPRPESNSVRVEFTGASGKPALVAPEWARSAEITCIAPIGTFIGRASEKASTLGVARIKLQGLAPEGIQHVSIGNRLTARLTLVDATGKTASASPGEPVELQGGMVFPSLRITEPRRWYPLTGFVVFDDEARLLGFGVYSTLLFLPQHSCLRR